MRLWHIGLVLVVIIASLGVVRTDFVTFSDNVAAQDGDTCEQWAMMAIASAQQACDNVARGELCLGNDSVSVSSPGGETLSLAGGDRVELSTVHEIRSQPGDLATKQWGLVLANLPAGLPESSAGVTAVLFGDTQLARPEHVVSDRPILPVYNQGAVEINLRNGAGIAYDVVGQLAAGEEVLADGRNEQGDWLRVRFSDGVGWVFAPLVDWDGDLMALEVLLPSDVSPVFSAEEPFQSFTLTSGTSSCVAAPSGLLLQAANTEQTRIQINQVTLEFSDATLLVTSVAGDALEVKVLAGSGLVTARGISQDAKVGTSVRVRLGDEDGLTPVAPPVVLQTYPFLNVAYAPLELLAEQISCTVGLPAQTDNVQLHVGPGENRGVLGSLSPDASYSVLGWADDSEGTTWWELDTGDQTSWAAQSEVRAIGACSQVAQVEAPPLVFAPPAPAAPSEGDSVAAESDLAPAANSVWQMVPGSDNMSGECSGAPAINFCDHLAAIAPASGGISWRGMEPSPYLLTQIQPNVYSYAGPNVNGTGTVNMTLNFTSETTLKMTMSLVLSSEPDCQHVYYYTGTRNW